MCTYHMHKHTHTHTHTRTSSCCRVLATDGNLQWIRMSSSTARAHALRDICCFKRFSIGVRSSGSTPTTRSYSSVVRVSQPLGSGVGHATTKSLYSSMRRSACQRRALQRIHYLYGQECGLVEPLWPQRRKDAMQQIMVGFVRHESSILQARKKLVFWLHGVM